MRSSRDVDEMESVRLRHSASSVWCYHGVFLIALAAFRWEQVELMIESLDGMLNNGISSLMAELALE